MLVPEHMDGGSRNQRLYETLKGMGLFVVPIPDENDPTQIAQILVSADLPNSREQAAEPRVHPVVKRAKIRDMVDAAKRCGMNVVDFPSELG